MATAAVALAGKIMERWAPGSIDEAGETVRLAGGAIARGGKLATLAQHLQRMNDSVQALFDAIDVESDASAAGRQSSEGYRIEKVQALARSAFALYFLFDEIDRRCESQNLMSDARPGVAQQVARLRELGDRLWGLADWLQMVSDPAIYEEKMRQGEEEIERGESEGLQ